MNIFIITGGSVMSKFKVGDIVKGISDNYGYTNTQMTKGKVVGVCDDMISVKILEHDWYKSDVCFSKLPEKDFELVESCKEKKHEFKVGDKVKIPTTKSLGKELKYCRCVNMAKEQNLKFLTIDNIWERFINEQTCYVIKGEYFAYEDLVPYVEKEPLKEDYIDEYGNRVIVNEPAVIYIVKFVKEDGGVKEFKGVAVCEPDDEFSKESGIELAFAKAHKKMFEYGVKSMKKTINKYQKR
jgi:hypothetical protein